MKKFKLAILMIVMIFCMSLLSCSEKKKEISWKLIWSDEFDGNELDLSKWSYQTGNAYLGWGNNEVEYYKEDNVTVENGMLVITAKKENIEDFQYTSGRIRTMNDSGECLFSTQYGKVEARISMPEGNGLWPAFWMMPANNVYGKWPLSGEIDIVEARGRINNVINGTIHFGEAIPNNKNLNGDYTFKNNETISEFHTYAIEWDTNEIKWTVDGKEYYKVSNWYSLNEEGVRQDYPAPFNQPFHILLNLAVGGTYDEGTLPEDSELPAQMKVDYVRVYENEDGYSDVSTKKKESEMDKKSFKKFEQVDNYISDTQFETVNKSPLRETPEYKDDTWYFLARDNFNGDGDATVMNVDGVDYFACKITEPGDKRYSVQLQHKVPFVKGYTYSIEFDLSKELNHYYCSFIMKEKTDLDGILEFNIGGEEGIIYIGNIQVKCLD